MQRSKSTLWIFSTVVFSLSLVLAIAGSPLCYAENGGEGKRAEKKSPPKSHPALYGFAATSRLNISVTATIDPNTGGFSWEASGPVPFFANGAAVAVDGKFLYIPNSFVDGQFNNGSQIVGYSMSRSKGTLTPLSGSPFFGFPPPVAIQSLAATPDGHFLYGADNTGIFAFSVDSQSGVPTEIAGSPFGSGAQAQLVVDPTGKFLYAADDKPPGGVLAFTINPDGSLTSVQGSPFIIPDPSFIPNSEPEGIVDTGQFVYVTLSGANRIAAFSVGSVTGALTRVPGSPFPAGKSPAQFALATPFLYVVNPGDGTVSGYSINPSNGALSSLPGSPFGAGGETIATDPSGKYLYLGTYKGIQGYNIDSATGVLTIGSAKTGEEGALWLTTVQLP